MKQQINKDKLTIPIYLNTKIVFDMLATIEDGFSEIKNIQTSKDKSRENEVDANIGASNLFAFLSVGCVGTIKTIIKMAKLLQNKKPIQRFHFFKN